VEAQTCPSHPDRVAGDFASVYYLHNITYIGKKSREESIFPFDIFLYLLLKIRG
jgi:hypothetical protein